MSQSETPTRAAALPLEAALALVLDRVEPLPARPVPLADALGLVLAEDAISTHPLPAFDSAAMDGFALRSLDVADANGERPVRLRIAGESRAGHPARDPIGAGEAVTIATGAMMPAGTDAVLALEQAILPQERIVEVPMAVAPGTAVRRLGEELADGDPALPAGRLLGPLQLGALASIGRDPVPCIPRPRVAVVTTGDELVSPGMALGPGQVHDCNSITVQSLARDAGAALSAVHRVPDEPELTREAIGAALEEADVIFVCGGVSVGSHDHVRPALAELGVQEVLCGLRMKPGRPAWFGCRGRSLVFGLPGNPPAAVAAFAVLAVPALLALRGLDPSRCRCRASAAAAFPRDPGRTRLEPCLLRGHGDATAALPVAPGHRGSMRAMLGAQALAIIPPGEGMLAAGERIEVAEVAMPA